MKKLINVTVYLFIGILILVAGLFLYVSREQQIDIGLIPYELTYCGKQIHGNNKNYKNIVTWLEKNKDGWKPSSVTYAPELVYQSDAFTVNVLSDAVVVSYKTDWGYPQFIKLGTHQLSTECDPNRQQISQ